VQLPPLQDIRLYVKLALVELVACHCQVRVHFLITIHGIIVAVVDRHLACEVRAGALLERRVTMEENKGGVVSL